MFSSWREPTAEHYPKSLGRASVFWVVGSLIREGLNAPFTIGVGEACWRVGGGLRPNRQLGWRLKDDRATLH